MIKVGITGGIGSGKTTIAHFFELLGIPVYQSDIRAKQLINTNPELIQQMKSLLGEEAYCKDASLNKAFVANKIFKNQSLLESVNALVHPAVEKDFLNFCSNNSDKPYVLKESAILFETDLYKKNDANILIVADLEERIKRVQKRSGLSRSEVQQRISKQWTDAQKELLADYIIKNNNTRFLIPQILRIDQSLRV